MNRFIPPLIVLLPQDSSLLTALCVVPLLGLVQAVNNTLTHGKVLRCQTKRSDMQITAEIVQTYDLLTFAIARSNGYTLLIIPPYNTT